MEILHFIPPIKPSTSYVYCDVMKLSTEIKLFGELDFKTLSYLKVVIWWRLVYIHKFKCKFRVTFYIFLSANQQRLYSFTPVVLLTVTAKNLPAMLK
jgi:hypothetical protein